MPDPICFLDMDDVLADFVGAALHKHGFANPYLRPECRGHWEIAEQLGVPQAEFWKPLEDYQFWATLPKTDYADAIVKLVEKYFGNSVAVCTSPSRYIGCMNAKYEWMHTNYPHLEKKMVFTRAKGLCARGGNWLIDDKDRNVREFCAGGGYGILLPRLWNSGWDVADQPLQAVESQIYDILENS
jgi:5'(3')-deoxyribonucleotidase